MWPFPRNSSPYKRFQEIFGDPAIVHYDYVSDPALVSLLWQFEHVEDSGSLEDSVFGDFVLPVDVRDASVTAHVWKAFSFHSCRVARAQDTLLYNRVLKTQAQ